jgi:predicted ester cyclase
MSSRSSTATTQLYVNPKHSSLMHDVFTQLEQGDWQSIEHHPGLYETRQHFPVLLAAFPNLTHRVEKEFSAGDHYTCIINVTGTHLGEYLGIPPTGTRVSFQLIAVDHIVDGIIVHHNAIPDAFSLFMQLGVKFVPAPVSIFPLFIPTL